MTGHGGGSVAARAHLLRYDAEPAVLHRTREICVIAQDPSVRAGRHILTATATVPMEHLEPGPRGARFHVVDYDATSRTLIAPDPWTEAIDKAGDAALRNDPRVRAQQVYAVAARTLDTFEHALGRRLSWSFAGHQLYLVPAAMAEANAFYDPENGAILFGYFEPPADEAKEKPGAESLVVYTSLSHDVIAHETTHAILDGMRSRFEEPSLADQAAFHEAFADVVALLSVLSLEEIVKELLPGGADKELLDATAVERRKLVESTLFGLAEEVGIATRAHAGGALRRSVDLVIDPTLINNPRFDEPHARGEIVVAAVAKSVLAIWQERLEGLHRDGEPLNRARAAEEGAKAAAHVLTMCIRAIDYLPPLDLRFDDFLAALITSDQEVVPDDRHGYRKSLRDSFGAYGIGADDAKRIQVGGAAGGPTPGFTYAVIHADELHRTDEIHRFIWENAAVLGIPIEYYLSVEDVQSCARVGPDGFIVREVVATYVQLLNGTYAELQALATRLGGDLTLPVAVAADARMQLQGGGTLIFDEFGQMKFHHPKPLLDWARQRARLAYLVGHGLADTRGGYGSSLGIPLGQRFAVMHADVPDEAETW